MKTEADNSEPLTYSNAGQRQLQTLTAVADVAGEKILYIPSTEKAGQKQLAWQLKETEELYRQLVELSPDVIVVHHKGKIVFINKAAAELYGVKNPEDLLGRNILDFVHPDQQKEVVTRVQDMLLKNKGVPVIEETFLKKDGTVIDVEVSAAPLTFKGKPAIQVVIRDITKHKQMSKEMSRLERLNLIGEMAASIGHEIRNPMTTVRGFLQMLLDKDSCAPYKHYFNVMIQELDRANSVITEFLSLARSRAVYLKPQNLNSILKTLSPLITADALNANKFVKEELGNVPDILLDEKEICQLILNLTCNGLEATAPGGSITIKTYTESDEVVLLVRDDGSGIDPAIVDKLGTPFFTTKDSCTGLGLAMCYSIASRHNAIIKIETSPNGTDFYVRFRKNKKIDAQ